MNYLGLIWKNSIRNKRRSLLTIGSIAASFCLLGVLMAIYNALFISTDTTPAQARRLVTRNRISLATVMPAAYKQKIQSIPGVEAVMTSQWFGGVYKDKKNFFARFACEPNLIFQVHPEFQLPEEQKKAFMSERTAAMVGRGLATKYGWKLGDKITLVGDIFPGNYEFTIRAIYDDALADETMWFNIDYLYQSLPAGRRDFAGTFTTLAKTPEDATAIGQQVDALFRNALVQTRTESERQFQASFVALLGNVKLYLFAMCAAITFTVLLVTANTIAMSVRERVREVGVLKTLGFTRGEILTMILGESGTIAFIGGALGCLIAMVLCIGVAKGAGGFIGSLRTLTLEPVVALAVIGLAVVIGLASAFVPAYQASRTQIVEAMRYTG